MLVAYSRLKESSEVFSPFIKTSKIISSLFYKIGFSFFKVALTSAKVSYTYLASTKRVPEFNSAPTKAVSVKLIKSFLMFSEADFSILKLIPSGLIRILSLIVEKLSLICEGGIYSV